MKRVIDICMTVLLLLLMAYQVTGEALHEWIGIGMTVHYSGGSELPEDVAERLKRNGLE